LLIIDQIIELVMFIVVTLSAVSATAPPANVSVAFLLLDGDFERVTFPRDVHAGLDGFSAF
jgi:hypothetical protein